jgi:hypothetical protein
MTASAFRKAPKEKNLTNKMMRQKMEELAQLMIALETTLMEWEMWYRLVPDIKAGMTESEYAAFLADGPIFSEIPEKIMISIRNQMPKREPVKPEEKKPVLFDGKGNVASVDDKPILQDSSGNIINK